MKDTHKTLLIVTSIFAIAFILNIVLSNTCIDYSSCYKYYEAETSLEGLMNNNKTLGFLLFTVSIVIIPFTTLLILKPKIKNMLLIPIIFIAWYIIGEAYVFIFKIPVIIVNYWEMSIWSSSTIFIPNNIAIIPIAFMSALILGFFGFILSHVIRKLFSTISRIKK